MRKHSIVALTLVFFTLALAVIALAADPHVGAWKQNLVKSKCSPGPPPKSQMLTITGQDNGIKVVMDVVDANGKAFHIVFAAKSISYTRIDANTLGFVVKKGGKEVEKGREFFSKDGKTWTWISMGKDDKGQDFNYTAVFDKQ
jgi:hypothetical protein